MHPRYKHFASPRRGPSWHEGDDLIGGILRLCYGSLGVITVPNALHGLPLSNLLRYLSE